MSPMGSAHAENREVRRDIRGRALPCLRSEDNRGEETEWGYISEMQ